MDFDMLYLRFLSHLLWCLFPSTLLPCLLYSLTPSLVCSCPPFHFSHLFCLPVCFSTVFSFSSTFCLLLLIFSCFTAFLTFHFRPCSVLLSQLLLFLLSLFCCPFFPLFPTSFMTLPRLIFSSLNFCFFASFPSLIPITTSCHLLFHFSPLIYPCLTVPLFICFSFYLCSPIFSPLVFHSFLSSVVISPLSSFLVSSTITLLLSSPLPFTLPCLVTFSPSHSLSFQLLFVSISLLISFAFPFSPWLPISFLAFF